VERAIASSESTASLREKMLRLASVTGTVIRSDGDFDKAHATAVKKIDAVYEVPFLAHAAMSRSIAPRTFVAIPANFGRPRKSPEQPQIPSPARWASRAITSKSTSHSSEAASAGASFRITP